MFFLVGPTHFSRQYGYVPFGVLDVSTTGRQTREGSRTLEVGPSINPWSSRLNPQ